MQSAFRLSLSISIWLIFQVFPAQATFANPSAPLLTVRADPSLTLALPTLVRQFSRQHNVAVDISFSPPGKELALIESGAPVDVFISPVASSLARLRGITAIDSFTQVTVAKNRLALAGPMQSSLNIDFEHANPSLLLQQEDRSLIIASPLPGTATSQPFVEAALSHLSLGADFKPYLFWLDSMQLLEDVLQKPGSHALLYESDVHKFSSLKTLALLPTDSHPDITYQAVAVEGPHVADARSFLQYMQSPEAQEILQSFGFTPVAIP